MVVIARPWATTARYRHAFTAAPSTSTVHTPHSASRQFVFVPVRPRSVRSTSSSVRSGSTSTSCVSPLISSAIAIFAMSAPIACRPPSRRGLCSGTGAGEAAVEGAADEDADEVAAEGGRGSDVVDGAAGLLGGGRGAAEGFGGDRLSFDEPFRLVGAQGGGGDGAEGDAGLEAVLEARVEGEARGHAHDGDLHGPTPARLQESRGRARGQCGKAHPGQELVGTARRLVRPDEEALHGQ